MKPISNKNCKARDTTTQNTTWKKRSSTPASTFSSSLIATTVPSSLPTNTCKGGHVAEMSNCWVCTDGRMLAVFRAQQQVGKPLEGAIAKCRAHLCTAADSDAVADQKFVGR